jgi:glycosyltransferase involved in cell wall biosynthesis
MKRLLVLSKRQYTNRDLLDDRFGRIRELPLQLALREFQVNGLCLSYKKKKEGTILDGPVRWESLNVGSLKLPGLLGFILRASSLASHADVIWACSDSFYGIIGYWLSRRYRIPLVFDLYDNFEFFLVGRLPIFKQMYRWVVRKCEAVTCVSRPLARLVESYGRKGPIYILENAVPEDLFRPLDKGTSRFSLGLPLDAKIIGTAGALEDNRGISSLFKAFFMLKPKYNDLYLALAGPRRTPLPVDERIIDLGSLPYDRVPLFLNALDVAVICNRENEFGKYCFPQKAREMMACRVPLVAARVGAMEELLSPHPEWLFDPEESEDLARSIEHRLKDPRAQYGDIDSWTDIAGILGDVFTGLVI